MTDFNLKIFTNEDELKKNHYRNNEFNVYIDDDSSYSISFENNQNVIADVYLKIDGKKMGCYRLAPKESYEINRPIRRKKELIFLSKTGKGKGKYDLKNKELGIIEAEFKTGVINLKHNDSSNKVFRPEKEGYIPEYMNIYNKHMKYEIDKPKDLFDYILDKHCDDCDCDSDYDLPAPEGKEAMMENSNECKPVDESSGFSMYGDDILDEKFKTYHQLLYDNKSTVIKIYLKCNKKYTKL